MDLRVLADEGEILSLLLGELCFLPPPAVDWAKDINHFPTFKDNNVFLRWVIASFDQALTLPFALLLDLAHCVFREVYLVATVAEIGRERYFLWHGQESDRGLQHFQRMSVGGGHRIHGQARLCIHAIWRSPGPEWL